MELETSSRRLPIAEQSDPKIKQPQFTTSFFNARIE